jgi:hypothetical protein
LAESDADQSKLFSRAMRIGRDHVASSVYTIAFATAGAGLSALLLITVYGLPLRQVAQTEALSEEIIRTLVGAIGLVLAMPLTTLIGVGVVRAGGIRRAGAPTEPRSARSVDRPTKVASPAAEQQQRSQVRPTAATTAPMDEKETTMLPKIRRAAAGSTGEAGNASGDPSGSASGEAPVAPQDQPAPPAAPATPSTPATPAAPEQSRRSRRGRHDDESFNFADLRGEDEEKDQPRGRRWR